MSKGSKSKRDQKKKELQKKRNIKESQRSLLSQSPSSSATELNKRIAYEGQVGQERREWCEQFISWKTEQLKKITTGQSVIEKDSGHRISCSKGCSFCCSQHIGASLQECDSIVYHLYQRDDICRDFLRKYPAWRARLREHEKIFQEVNQAGSLAMCNPDDASAREVFMQKSRAYGELNIPCPFLEAGACSIYPVRPFVCANAIVVSPPEDCKSSSTNPPILLIGAPSQDTQPAYFRGPKDAFILSTAPQLVYEILMGGFIYLNDLPGLDGLEKEAFSDPRILSIARGVAFGEPKG